MIEASVSNIDLLRIWKQDEDLDLGWILNKIQVREETDAMRAGTAFHKAIEDAPEGDYRTLQALGHTFTIWGDYDLALPKIKEVGLNKMYSGMLVKGRVDALGARVVHELKTTSQFDPDRYLDRLQHKFYMDMTGADRHDWHIFVIRQTGSDMERAYDVYQYHYLTQCRYPGLHEDCMKAAEEYREFAERFLVGWTPPPSTNVGAFQV